MDPAEAIDVSDSSSSDELDAETHARVQALDAEIHDIDQQLSELARLKTRLRNERRDILAQHAKETAEAKTRPGYYKNYSETRFPWSTELLRQAQTVFGIQAFRMCQEGVCNAALDNRDLMVVMPTGAGKSLCYQLPALLGDGLTLVISPLISLMHDQVFHLRELNIPASLLSSSVPREAADAILRSVRNPGSVPDAPRLLYVTPERICKSKSTLSALQRAYEDGRLLRIVIDEAHCCSQIGHDYRPDYRRLSICRRLFPATPIMGLTATLGPRVLHDVIQILGLPGVVDPSAAPPRGTVYFRAPLHRPNLHFGVRMRPSSTLASHQAMVEHILRLHPGQSGIVYCLSRKDTRSVADALEQLSDGRIRTGVYHSDLDEQEKHAVHSRWRTGEILVVCATIAFGMGIDKGDVRFVIHACLSKSMDGYYQEAGRAGCVCPAAAETHIAVAMEKTPSASCFTGQRIPAA